MKRILCLTALALLPVASAFAQDGYSASGVGVNYEMRLSSIEDQLRALTGKTEQMEYALRRLDQTLTRMQNDYETRLTKLETAPPPVAAQPIVQPIAQPVATPTQPSVNTQPADPSPNGRLGAIKMQGDQVTGATRDGKTPPLPEKPADYGLTPQEQYDRAFGLLRQASYDEAERAFKNFIDKNQQDKLLDNAKYWYGETFYVRGKFSDAAVSFAEAFQQNPKGTKAPDSLLKLGMALGALGKTEDACLTFASFRKSFPNAPVASRSRVEQERTRLKCKP